jgi:hypothetical protein
MGVNGDRLEIDPAHVQARVGGVPALREDLTNVSLGTLTEIIGTFAASASTLAAATRPSIPLTDDYPISEYVLQSRLRHHMLPANIFELRPIAGVADWCPRCRIDGRFVDGLDLLPTYLKILSPVYADLSYLQSIWVESGDPRVGVAIRSDPLIEQTIAASRYLQHLTRMRRPAPPRPP